MSEDKKIDGQVVVEHNASGMIVKEVIWKGVPYKNEPPFFKHEGNKYGTPEPTIKVSELRKWCEENTQQVYSPEHGGEIDYISPYDLLTKFCGGKNG